MIRSLLILLFGAAAVLSPAVTLAQQASFRVLAFYTSKGEPDHIVQRGLDFGASGYVIRDRLRSHVVKAGLVAMFVGPTRHEPDRRQVPRWPMARPDACPYSPGGDFRACPAFVPIDIPMGSDGEAPRTSCSHLRVGTAATWRLYPRCALGDAVAREKYLLDLSC